MSTDETSTPAALDRRSLLKRGALVGGAMVWATPVVQSIGGTALAVTANGSEEPGDVPYHFNLAIGRATSGNKDKAVLTLTNSSSSPAIRLTGFKLQLASQKSGQNFQFDALNVQQAPPGVGWTVTSPANTANDLVRSQLLAITFTPGIPATGAEVFTAEFDLGAGPENTTNYIQALLATGTGVTGSAATYTVTFSNGGSYTDQLSFLSGEQILAGY